MGHQRKRYNEKARSNNIQVQETQKIDIVVDINNKEKYDASNPLVIVDTKKKKPKFANKESAKAKSLSKKQRKKLEKVLETKRKKLNRAELLNKLSEVQATNEDLKQLTSTADMQTFGIKRLLNEYPQEAKRRKISNIKGINKKSTKNVDNDSSSPKSCKDSSSSDDDDEEIVSYSNHEDVEEKICNTETNSEVEEKERQSNEIEKKKEDRDILVEKKPEEKINKVQIPTVFIPVHRKPEIQEARKALPIFSEEQPLIEAIKENPVVIVHGETGSGKTTQIPQFLFEAGFTQNNMLIGITEPRRIAAMTMAARVGEEMDMPDAVSYHIRYEKTVNPQTQIKFMTDGVLLKEIRKDFFLSKYSVIIIDEAHERSIFTDVLIGLLSRIIRRDTLQKKKYPPLKLIIMSATMCVDAFMDSRLFKTEPFLFQVSSRQYTVQAHFNKYTPDDYVDAAYHKVCKIHRQLPSGAILVFLTGEEEIIKLCKMLKETFPFNHSNSDTVLETQEVSTKSFKKMKKKRKKDNITPSSVPDINLDDYNVEPLDNKDLQNQWTKDEELPASTLRVQNFDMSTPLHVLPLYSALPLKEQNKVFQPPPSGSRLCVVSTNVAETSVTIPGLKYVVDTGKVKTKVYNNNSGGVSQFVITWCSKASANQRTGRAGRTEGGHCYRLYSSAVFEDKFPDFSLPEIKRIPVDDVILQVKALSIPNVVNFPFPTPPAIEELKAAEKRLVLLDALEDISKNIGRYKDCKEREYSAPVTKFGRLMARFPLSPRYSVMLLLSKKHNCIPHIIAIICAMTVPQVFLSSVDTSAQSKDCDNAEGNFEEDEDHNSESIKIVRKGIKKIGAGTGKYLQLGDAMVLLRTVALYEESKNKVKFCYKNNINYKAMVEIHKMGLQLIKEMNENFTDLNMPLTLQLKYPEEEEVEKMRKIVAAGFVDHIARKWPSEQAKIDKKFKNAYQCLELEEPVFIHPSSILFQELPEYVVFQEINITSKHFMKGVIEIKDYWIPGLAPSFCEFSDPKDDSPPVYDKERDKILVNMDVTIGRWSWEIQALNMEMPKGFLKYQWFCFFLLDGQVYQYFSKYHKFVQPSTVLKKWARTYKPLLMQFLNALITKEIDSRKSLEETWTVESKYLLREFLALIPSSRRLEIECNWPPKS